MQDYSTISLAEARREYLASCTTAMPVAGFVAWAALAVAAYVLGSRLPSYSPFIAAALPVPLSVLIDKLLGRPGLRTDSRRNPITQLFMRSITVVALLVPFVIIAARAAGELDLLILGVAILAGVVWVPHGWGADDPAGSIHFVMRAVLCYAAYLVAPDPIRGAAVAAAAATTYVYAIVAMKKPSSVRVVPVG